MLKKVINHSSTFQYLICCVFAYFSLLAICANRTMETTSPYQFLTAFNPMDVTAYLLFIGLVFFYVKTLQIKEHRTVKYAAITAFILTSCEVVGNNINQFNHVINGYLNLYTILFNFIIFSGIFLLFYHASLMLFNAINTKQLSAFTKRPRFLCGDKYAFFYLTGLFILFWLVYYILLFPGITTWDSYYQITQGVGYIPINNQNPIIHTMILGFIIKIGRFLFGNTNAGVGLFICIQMIGTSMIYAYSIHVMAKKNTHILFLWFMFIFYAFHPLVACYSITLWKDIWMSSFLLLYLLFLIRLSTDKAMLFENKLNYLYFTLILLGIFFSKGTGIIMLVISLPFVFIVCKKYWKSILCITILTFSIYFVVTGPVLKAYHIGGAKSQDTFSVPLQQIARTVRDHRDTITSDEQEIISEILPYDQLPELYQPRLADNVKETFDYAKYKENKFRYIKTWLNIGLKHPVTYLDSLLCNSFGYWYPGTRYWIISSDSYLKKLNMYKENGWYYGDHYDYQPISSIRASLQEYFFNFIEGIRYLPIISMFFSIGFYTWIIFVLIMICFFKKQYKLLLPFSVLIAVFISCILSPVHAEMRYAYTLIIATPLMLAVVLSTKKKTEEE